MGIPIYDSEEENKIVICYTECEIFIIRMIYYFMKNNEEKTAEEVQKILETQGISKEQFYWGLERSFSI